MSRRIIVVKIGGSVLTGGNGYRRAADFLAKLVGSEPGCGIVAVVSAELGMTDALLATAREIVEAPDPSTLDLLWSTGELRSAALLALALQSRGLRAAGINVHQAGLIKVDDGSIPGRSMIRPLRLRALLAAHDVIVAPGFLARDSGDAVVSLGRGGSDLTAVLLAAGLDAVRCELLKDVPGYFTADPKRDPDARPIPSLCYDRALQMSENGCELVQHQALLAAREHNLPLTISAIGSATGSRIDNQISR